MVLMMKMVMILMLTMVIMMMALVDWDDGHKIELCPTDTTVFGDLNVRFVQGAISYLLEGPPIYMFVSQSYHRQISVLSLRHLTRSFSSIRCRVLETFFVAILLSLILALQTSIKSTVFHSQ